MDIHLGIQLAQNLQLSAAQLTDLTQYSEARIFSEYSVNILRQLHNRYPRRKQIRTALSDALQTYTISLGKSWRTGDACLVSEECVALRRITYKGSRKQNRLKMVVSLVLRGICLRDMYRFEDALSVFSEAVVLARKIAPAENTFNLSITLCHYGMCLLDLGEFSNASSVLNEAFMFNQGSDESVEQARSSSNLSPVFPTADGVSMAISHWRLMFNNGGDQFRAIYLMSLEKLGDVLGILLFTEAAQKARAEAQWVRSLTRS
jgi:tetratricopeptide (TPR) repeat protein